MDKRDIDEANRILDFQEREMGWKDLVLWIGVTALVYFVASVIAS